MEDYFEYKEYEDLGRYFAYLKHQMITSSWSHFTEKGLQHFDQERPIHYSPEKYVVRSNITDIAEITRLDASVARVAFGDSLEWLSNHFDTMELLEERKEKHGEYLKSWSNYISKMLSFFNDQPEAVIHEHIRTDIFYVYNEEYYRLTELLGEEEFLQKVKMETMIEDVFIKRDNFPKPVDFINGQPVRTVGQLEEYVRLLNGVVEYTGVAFPRKEQISLELVEDYNDPEEDIYEFYDVNHLYSSNDSYHIFTAKTLEEAAAIYEFLSKQIGENPAVNVTYAHRLLMEHSEEHNILAKKLLVRAIEIYESLLPDDFQSWIQSGNHDEFHFGLAFLGYLLLKEGNLERGLQFFKRAQEFADDYADFSEDILDIQTDLDKFLEDFKHSHFVEYDTMLRYYVKTGKLKEEDLPYRLN